MTSRLLQDGGFDCFILTVPRTRRSEINDENVFTATGWNNATAHGHSHSFALLAQTFILCKDRWYVPRQNVEMYWRPASQSIGGLWLAFSNICSLSSFPVLLILFHGLILPHSRKHVLQQFLILGTFCVFQAKRLDVERVAALASSPMCCCCNMIVTSTSSTYMNGETMYTLLVQPNLTFYYPQLYDFLHRYWKWWQFCAAFHKTYCKKCTTCPLVYLQIYRRQMSKKTTQNFKRKALKRYCVKN